MSRIPAFPFRVLVFKKTLAGKPPLVEQHNYAELAGALSYRATALKRPNTKKVEVHCVIDESVPGSDAVAASNDFKKMHQT